MQAKQKELSIARKDLYKPASRISLMVVDSWSLIFEYIKIY